MRRKAPAGHDQTELSYNERAMSKGRVLAIDLGARRIGLAVSDELRFTARPLPAIRRTNQFTAHLAALCRELEVSAIVIGLPLRMDGSEGEAAQRARAAAEEIGQATGLPVYLQDERLTTREAAEELREAGFRGDALRQRLDSAAALIILRDFLSRDAPDDLPL